MKGSRAAAMAAHYRKEQELQRLMSSLCDQPPKKIIDRIRAGDNMATQAIVMMPAQWVGYRRKLVNAGLVDAILSFVEMSTNNGTFEDVLLGCRSKDGTGGDVAFPSVWTNALMNLAAKGNLPEKESEALRANIANRIGPMLEAMTDMDVRRFFQSRKYWFTNLAFFVGLVENLVLSRAITVPILDQYGDYTLRKFLVQALFFDLYRQDIKEELAVLETQHMVLPDCIGGIQQSAIMGLQEFMDVPTDESGPYQDYQYKVFTKEGKATLNHFGNLPAVHTANNDDNTTTLASGILKVAQTASKATVERRFSGLLWIFGQLHRAMPMRALGKDLDIAGKLVDIGRTKAWRGAVVDATNFHPKNAFSIICAINNHVIRPIESESSLPGQTMPKDETMAASIDAGLIELYIDMLHSASHDNEDVDNVTETLIAMEHTLKGACVVALSRRTNKQLVSRALSLRKNLGKIPKTPMHSRLHINQNRDLINALLDRAASVNQEDDTRMCRFCLTSGTDIKLLECARCRRVSYCSKACQKGHWKHHKKDCKLMETNEARAIQDGASKKDTKAAQKFEANLSSSGNTLFASEIHNILLQASLRRLSILDCVVVLDFSEARPSIVTQYYDDFIRESEDATTPEQSAYTKGIVHRNRTNGALTAICYAYVADGGKQGLLKTFPPEGAGTPRDPTSVPKDIAALSSPWLRQQRLGELDLEFQRIINNDAKRESTIRYLTRPGSTEDSFASQAEQDPNSDTMGLMQMLLAGSNISSNID